MSVSRLARRPATARAELVPFKQVCRRMGIHPNSGYKYRREGRFPIEIIELGDRLYCRAADLDAYTRTSAAG